MSHTVGRKTMKIIKEIIGELRFVFLGKSMDIIVPPILFLVLNAQFDLLVALIGSLLFSLFFFVKRILKKENWLYSLGGFLGVLFAIFMALINDNASNFFLPDLIGTGSLIIITITSLIIKKPLAIWVSHITRGWDLKWFYLKEVKPAYQEVTIFWLVFFITRLGVEIYFYTTSSVEELAVANVILGYPVLILVLTISYIYGIARLRQLKGPGIDEYREGKMPPYRGQNRGF